MALFDITITKTTGIFNPGAINFTAVDKESGTEAEFPVDVSGCKEPLYAIVDTSGIAGAAAYFSIKSADGTKQQDTKLNTGHINFIPVTTQGFKTDDGKITLSIWGNSLPITAAMNLKIALVSHIPVVNN